MLSYKYYTSDYKFIFLILSLFILSIFNVGGCNDNSGSSNPDLVVIGAHRDIALTGISNVIPITPHLGNPTNILLDGVMISDLSDDEIALVAEAYQAGFTIVFYEVSEADIIEIYSQIIDHPIHHSEIESLEGIIEGDMSPIFTIERHGNVDWTSTGDFLMGNPFSNPDGTLGETNIPDPEEVFIQHGLLIRDWLKSHPNRQDQVIEDSESMETASKFIDDLGLSEELDEQIGIDTRDEFGTLISLAAANIHTSIKNVSFNETDKLNSYQMVSKAYILTEDTPNGVFSFLLVSQDFTLASRNGFVKNVEGSRALSGPVPDQYWYLKEFSVNNRYQVGRDFLDSSDAFLLKHSPDTNQSSNQSSTTSLTHNFNARIAADSGTTGATGNIALTAGVNWGTSTTVSKANVSINNLSGSDSDLLNDATWQFLPRRPERGGQRGTCRNFGLRNLADLAHNTFSPSTAFVVRIVDDYVGRTLKIKSQFTIQLEQSFIQNCGPFGCNCGVGRWALFQPNAWRPTTTHSIRIPYPPEGPVGDATCSDGIDNDSDGDLDSDDSSCQS